MSAPVEHRPQDHGWVIVAQTERSVVISAMCVCGDDNCGFTGTSYATEWVHVTR